MSSANGPAPLSRRLRRRLPKTMRRRLPRLRRPIVPPPAVAGDDGAAQQAPPPAAAPTPRQDVHAGLTSAALSGERLAWLLDENGDGVITRQELTSFADKVMALAQQGCTYATWDDIVVETERMASCTMFNRLRDVVRRRRQRRHLRR